MSDSERLAEAKKQEHDAHTTLVVMIEVLGQRTEQRMRVELAEGAVESRDSAHQYIQLAQEYLRAGNMAGLSNVLALVDACLVGVPND